MGGSDHEAVGHVRVSGRAVPASMRRRTGRDAGDDFDAAWPVEHERETVEGLLVATMRVRRKAGSRPGGRAVGRPYVSPTTSMCCPTRCAVDAFESVGQMGGEHETDRDRFTVRHVVVARGLERVRERVPVVQDRTAPALALVGRHDVGLDATQRATRSSSASPAGSHLQEVILGHLAEPQRNSRVESVSRASRSQTTPCGCQNAPTRFLPSGRFTPVLPPIAASTIARSVVATWTTGTPRW